LNQKWQKMKPLLPIQRNWPYGNEEFEERIEISLGRKFEIKKAGRKPKM